MSPSQSCQIGVTNQKQPTSNSKNHMTSHDYHVVMESLRFLANIISIHKPAGFGELMETGELHRSQPFELEAVSSKNVSLDASTLHFS